MKALEDGSLTIEDMRACALRILGMILKLD